MIRFERFWILLGILVVFGEVGGAGAVVFQVPGDFGTIQGAIDAAAGSGDEIVVAPGTYGEVINFLGKAINLHSLSGTPADTIIDGTGLNDSVVLCISGEGAGTVLEGFTITGGTGSPIPFPGITAGGGMLNLESSPTVANCIFRGNSAGSVGGMLNDNSNATVMNCLFTGNAATTSSIGGMGCRASSPMVTNCTFSGNSGGILAGGFGAWAGGHPVITNCTFVGNTASIGGAIYSSSFGQQVTATNCIFWDNGSNEIAQAGQSTIEVSFSAFPPGYGFEFTDGGGNISANPAFVDADGSDNIPGTLDDDLRLQRFSPCIDAGDNSAVGLESIMTDGEGNPRFIDDAGAVDSGLGKGPMVDMGALERQTDSIRVTFRVPKDYSTVRGAIVASALNGDEIVVAPGTYNEVIDFEGRAVHLRSESGNPADTIIDGTGLNDSVVLFISGEGARTILDGFAVTGGTGHINGVGERQGGGMFCNSRNPSVTNCIFSGNSATSGGGMYNRHSNPSVTNCTFSGNSVTDKGGGIYNFINSNPIITSCIFNGNSAAVSGGGMYSRSSHPSVTNCTFSDNTAFRGGGMVSKNSNPSVINCIFSGNTATFGGGMYNPSTGRPSVTNCTFSGNTATFGGGMYNWFNSNPTMTNCTFSGNTANHGGGILNINSSNPTVTNCTFWGDIPNEIFAFDSGNTTTISFSNVQGGLPAHTIDGGGNINAAPLFVDAFGPDNIPGTADDDLRLQPGSPCIDAGINNGVIGDLVDLNADGCILERIPLDIDGNLRFMDDLVTENSGCGVSTLGVAAIVDMGAFEFPGTPAPKILIGDINGNGLINIDDLVDVLNAFWSSSGCSDADVNGDGGVGMMDLLAVLDGFGGCG